MIHINIIYSVNFGIIGNWNQNAMKKQLLRLEDFIFMAIFYNVIAFLGGLAMFLYGMRVMGDGLKSSSGTAMRDALAKVTNRPVMGFILGMLVACIIQRSTASIVITVGPVGA